VIPSSLGTSLAGLKLTVVFALIGAIIGEFNVFFRRPRPRHLQGGQLYHHPESFAALVATIALARSCPSSSGKLERFPDALRKLRLSLRPGRKGRGRVTG